MSPFPYLPESSDLTRYLFFTGKGGVGKTSLSCATALRLAQSGRKVLLVSTDPASNLEEVFSQAIGGQPTNIAGISGLDAMNLDPVAVAGAYREKMISPLRGILPEAALRKLEEELSGSCTVEIAAFDEFSGIIGDTKLAEAYHHVVFDTAPTGHTLRLMGLAKAWDRFLDENTSGMSCLGPLAGLEKQRAVYASTVATLADASATTLMLVSRPHSAAQREARRTSIELRELGICNQRLILNGVFMTDRTEDPLATAMMRRGQEALAEDTEFLTSMLVFSTALLPANLLGLGSLRAMFFGKSDDLGCASTIAAPAPKMQSLATLVAELESGGPGVIMAMGKGGVGKTTLAAAIAVSLAERGHAVHLSTTDPAAHLVDTLSVAVPGLNLSRIDPARETAAYREEVMATQGPQLDDAARALLEEDLRSPCTEEIAVFRAFAREVARGDREFVVLDTAPTGHTLLLLDASEAYQRELERQSRGTQPESVVKLLSRLRDPAFTRVLLVALPEATPVHEAAALQEDLRRAGIEPFGWILNQCLLHQGTADPVLQQRQRMEIPYIREVDSSHARRLAWVPWQHIEPVGPTALLQLLTPDPPP